mmetsp:Transcript_10675/g.28524  ORF Transcript_10675/g.28524 Transcript_10675/m.28524 type:complete len:206 (-) Transcript_10675:156-773(-)
MTQRCTFLLLAVSITRKLIMSSSRPSSFETRPFTRPYASSMSEITCKLLTHPASVPSMKMFEYFEHVSTGTDLRHLSLALIETSHSTSPSVPNSPVARSRLYWLSEQGYSEISQSVVPGQPHTKPSRSTGSSLQNPGFSASMSGRYDFSSHVQCVELRKHDSVGLMGAMGRASKFSRNSCSALFRGTANAPAASTPTTAATSMVL